MSGESIRVVLALVITIAGLALWPRFSKLNAFFSLLFASMAFALIAGMPVETIIGTMQAGFGSLLSQIGFVIALGSVLGMVLDKTGAMTVISEGVMRIFGQKRPVIALSIIGALVGIPVFCDSGFIILSRLIPALALKAGASHGSLVLALSSGLYATHTLVPPTPGPLTAAATLGLGSELGVVILVGILASVPVVLAGYIYAARAGKRIAWSATPHTDVAIRQISWVRAFLPLVIPIVLISAASFGKLAEHSNFFINAINIAGTPVVALLLGVLLALTLVDRATQKGWPEWITEALKDAGVIILITGAGGAFGAVIKASPIGTLIAEYAEGSQLQKILFLLFTWFIAAILKTAQGSGTSSMIITSSLMAPLATAAGFTTVPELSVLLVAIAGGAMAVSHPNDSYFWVVSQFGGIDFKDTFARYTPMTFLLSLTTLITSIALFLLL